jgi:hypothetical protein
VWAMWPETVRDVRKPGALRTARETGRGPRRAALVRASATVPGCAVKTGSVLKTVTTGTNKSVNAGLRFVSDTGANVSLVKYSTLAAGTGSDTCCAIQVTDICAAAESSVGSVMGGGGQAVSVSVAGKLSYGVLPV